MIGTGRATSPIADPTFNCLGYFGTSYNDAFGDGVSRARAKYGISWDISCNGVSGNNDPSCPAAGQLGVSITYSPTAVVTIDDYNVGGTG